MHGVSRGSISPPGHTGHVSFFQHVRQSPPCSSLHIHDVSSAVYTFLTLFPHPLHSFLSSFLPFFLAGLPPVASAGWSACGPPFARVWRSLCTLTSSNASLVGGEPCDLSCEKYSENRHKISINEMRTESGR